MKITKTLCKVEIEYIIAKHFKTEVDQVNLKVYPIKNKFDSIEEEYNIECEIISDDIKIYK